MSHEREAANLPWDDLRYFLAVARSGSANAAATALGLAHTTVSRRLKTLEGKLGTHLFDRHGPRVILTPEGEAVLEEAIRIEESVLAITRRVRGADTRLAGEVRVSVTDGLGTYWLIPQIQPFLRANPKLHINWLAANSLPQGADSTNIDIGQGKDIIIFWWRPTAANAVVRKLGSTHYSIYTTQAYVDRFGLPTSVEDLAAHRLLQFNGYELNPGLKPWNDLIKKLGAAMRLENTAAAESVFRTGEYVTLLPDYSQNVAPGFLVKVPVELDITLEVWLCYHEEKRGLARVRSVAAEIGRLARAARGVWFS